MDMRDIPQVFDRIDLLWSEGAAYDIAFADALEGWAPALAPSGLAVISELSWLNERVPVAVEEFFRSGYPDMRSVPRNHALARSAGYRVLATHALPNQAWVDGYYDILEPRARALLDHLAATVRELARATIEELEVFQRSDNSYGYVFYVLQRA